MNHPRGGNNYRFDVDQYELMGRTGILDPDARTELLDGVITNMFPITPRHAGIVTRLNWLFQTRIGKTATVRTQNPIRLVPDSHAQPDIVIAEYRRDYYRGAHPVAKDIRLMIEVADDSLAFDRAIKLPVYARHRIVEIWLVDLATDAVNFFRPWRRWIRQDAHRGRRGAAGPCGAPRAAHHSRRDPGFSVSRVGARRTSRGRRRRSP